MATQYQDTIVLFGDSLTQMGWNPELGGIGARVTDLYARKLDVLNRGYSGYNTDWALPLLKQIIVKREFQPHAARVRLLTIWFGANDACLPEFRQHVPISRFSENLTTMIRAIREPESPWYSPETRVFLITPPPIHIPSMRADLKHTRTFDTTESYAEEVRNVGKKEGVPVVDAWSRIWEAARKDREAVKAFLTDGLHLNGAGYKVVFSALTETLTQNYPELDPENLRSVFPLWDYFHSHTVEEFESENWLDKKSRAEE
ncbi:SGNH hydrolase [Lactarius vividus]|nr:SGNH hydrolase [Lactarius vividus]